MKVKISILKCFKKASSTVKHHFKGKLFLGIWYFYHFPLIPKQRQPMNNKPILHTGTRTSSVNVKVTLVS